MDKNISLTSNLLPSTQTSPGSLPDLNLVALLQPQLEKIIESSKVALQTTTELNSSLLELLLLQNWIASTLSQALAKGLLQDNSLLNSLNGEKKEEATPEPNLSPKYLLEILGYCSCTPSSPELVLNLPKPIAVHPEVPESPKSDVNNMSHGSYTQSICHKDECKECEDEPNEGSLKLDDPMLDEQTPEEPVPLNVREEDEYLMDIHPFENIYVTNPKTGRKVKKIVCKHPGCGKAFDKKWNFKDHIRMHRGDKPYKCPKCPKTFTQKGNLDKHMKQHEFKDLKSRKIHVCKQCGKRFTEKYNLKNHMKKHAAQDRGKSPKKRKARKSAAKN